MVLRNSPPGSKGRLTPILSGLVLVGGALPFVQAASQAGQGAQEGGAEGSLQAELAHLDPLLGGWDSEVQQAAAKAAFKTFLKAVLEEGQRAPADLGPLLADSFAGCTELRPSDLLRTCDDGVMQAYRASSWSEERLAPDELGAALNALCSPYASETTPHAIFKVITSAALSGGGFETEMLVQVDGVSDDGRLQQNFTWRVSWVGGGEAPLQIQAIDLLEFTEAHAPRNIYSEVTEAMLGKLPYYKSQLLHGVNDYTGRYDALGGGAFLGSQGITVADINGDGLDDMYICQEGTLPNRLLLHNRDGSLTDITNKSKAGVLDSTRCALMLDLDADGDQDLALAIGSNILLLYNDGKLDFSEGQWLLDDYRASIFSIASADPDGDGDLDLYACRHNSLGSLGANPIPLFDANNGSPNLYWRNDGERKFSQVTDEVGLGENNTKFSFAALWEDVDGDGDLDLMVANDFGRNNLYRNDGGHFKDVGAEAGVAEVAASMGLACADYDLDGDVDVLVSNMFSAAGQRTVSHEDKFMEHQRPETKSLFERTARGNTLLSNRGDGTYQDATLVAGVQMGRWSWGSRFIDFNNDGYEDMYIPNGFVTNKSSADL